MTILLYDYRELQERPAKHLKAWKAWHLIIYVFAAVFSIANYVFLQNSMELVDHKCILFPRKLEFIAVGLPESQMVQDLNDNYYLTDNAQSAADNTTSDGEINAKAKRNTEDNKTTNADDDTIMDGNETIFTGNKTHRLALDTSRSLFESGSDCMFAEYMPLMSMVFAIVWVTMFTMCSSGGHVRSGLTQPWRILAPALLFALVMVGLTGHSFLRTNGGTQAFCEGFYELTNTTSCSAVDPFLELSWNKTWGMGGRILATRAASATVWASWAFAAALLLTRCLVAPDFVVKRTTVYLTKDPDQQITPYLKKSRKSQQLNHNSPNKGDNISVISEPTVTTELVTASVEQGDGDSAPTSLIVTPVKTSTPRHTENIEMTYNPQECQAIQQ